MKIFHKDLAVEGFWALKDVSFEVEPGEVVGIKRAQRCRQSSALSLSLGNRYSVSFIIPSTWV